MSKVNVKMKWQHGSPVLTLRISGTWLDILSGLHDIGKHIVEDAKTLGWYQPTGQPLRVKQQDGKVDVTIAPGSRNG
jgi:hypothetical protein